MEEAVLRPHDAAAATVAPTGARAGAATRARAASEAPALALHGITKRWPRQERPVLDQLDLVLEPGTSVLLRGRNGVGKTTLLRIAAGMIMPDRGAIEAFGLDPERDRTDYARRIGLLSAGDRGLYARLSVWRNIEFSVALSLIPRSERGAVIERALARFSLEDLARRRVDRLSMGQRQRVRLAIALVHEPDVVLLDEPSTSLDSDGLGLLSTALREITGRGGAVIWCSPTGDQEQLAFARMYVLEQGALKLE
jgi:ABC-type multidrug transport system ATPase subunit